MATNLLDHFFGANTPAGLLTPDGLQRARRQGLLSAGLSMLGAAPTSTLGQTIAAGAQGGQQGYAGVAGADVAAQKEQERNALLAKAGINPGAPLEQQAAQLRALIPGLIRIGDTKSLSSLTEYLKSVDNQQTATRLLPVNGGDRVLLTNPVTGQTVREIPVAKTTPEKAPPAKRLVSVQTPTGPQYAEYDPATRRFTLTGQTPPGSNQVSDGERKALMLGQAMKFAMPQLDAADAPNRLEMLARNHKIGEVLSSEQQKNMIAGKAIIEAWMRLTSGAAISESELSEAAQRIVPLPGDKPETLAYKRALRHTYMRAIQSYAQRAARQQIAAPATERPSLDDLE